MHAAEIVRSPIIVLTRGEAAMFFEEERSDDLDPGFFSQLPDYGRFA